MKRQPHGRNILSLSAVKKSAAKKAPVAKKAAAKKAGVKKATAKKATAKKATAKKATAKKVTAKKAAANKAAGRIHVRTEVPRLMPPEGGAVVRMYRTGHGDCFLLAFAGDKPGHPSYVLIDCGYKPGSPGHLAPTDGDRIDRIVDDIIGATGGKVQLAVITHEHQDHVNGINEKRFRDLEIGELWLAWTEDPQNARANELRKQQNDVLLGLISARNRLALDGDDTMVGRLDEFISFELGGTETTANAATRANPFAAAADGTPPRYYNKESMNVFKRKVSKPIFKTPHKKIEKVPGASGVRAYVLGPPADDESLESMDPVESEGEVFPDHAMAMSSAANYFASAAKAAAIDGGAGQSPFHSRYRVDLSKRDSGKEAGGFFQKNYGPLADAPERTGTHPTDDDLRMPKARDRKAEVPDHAPWRQIDRDWLYSSLQLAMNVNDATNNTSLALAFELRSSGKVLLFAADAQRGNIRSWNRKTWRDGDKEVTVRELMGRTVLYKASHHCSHNGTLNGNASSSHPNISWLGDGEHKEEFTAMITAVESWAALQKGWVHPYKPIKDALLKKADGRVFQTDTDPQDMVKPDHVSKKEWNAFLKKVSHTLLYFDHEIR